MVRRHLQSLCNGQLLGILTEPLHEVPNADRTSNFKACVL